MARESAHRVGPRQSAAETGDEHSRREGRGTEGWRQAVVRDRAQEAMGSWPRVPAARVQTLVCEEQHTSCPAVQQEKKYTEADLDAAVARVLANRGSVQQAPSPFGFTDLADSPAPTELLPVDIPEASEKAVKGPSAKAQSDSLPMATSSAPMPVLLSASHNQEVKPGVKPVSQAQDYWLCSCERKPPVNVQAIEAPTQL